MSHVFNFDVPINADDYVHRIGRITRRRSGRAITLAAPDEKRYLDTIVGLTGVEIPRLELDEVESTDFEEEDDKPRGRRGRSGSQSKNPSDNAKPEAPKSDDDGSVRNGKSRISNRKKARESVRDDDGPDETPVGLGDHVPAFL